MLSAIQDLMARPLSRADKDAAFAEGQASALLYGATGTPRCWDDWAAALAAAAPGLEGSAILADFLRIMQEAPILPAPLRWLQRLLVRAAVQITPEPVRSLPQLQGRGLRRGEATLVRVLARTAALLPLRATPPAQAARRLRQTPPKSAGA
ncbi:oxygenase MpaB family protein [Duganella sp. BuS-21]|uniref:oxygenase MpaB family protein n=1 Tax=Duganella sp. BuS-21 TaxID=2943848 RepID=UPI0035A6ED00